MSSQTNLNSRKKNRKRWMILMGCLACFTIHSICYHTNILLKATDRLLIIPRGYSCHKLADMLKKEGYIANKTTFLWTAYLLRYNPQIAPGQYLLKRNMNNWQAIKMLRGGMQYPVKLTFATAANKISLVEQLVQNIGIEQETLSTLLDDTKVLSTYGFSPENVLAMFIPDSYEVYWTITAAQLLSKMYAAYQHFWNKTRLDKAKKMQLAPISVSILASIVQAETNDQQEATMIAGVYYNRLKRKMRIESCPVLVYALKKKGIAVKRVLQEDAYIISPYNSYRQKGLPPGPIALPSMAMIDAVLNYVRHNYLFFSAKEDFAGLHYFTDNYVEHLKNARKYRKALNLQKIMR